MSANLKRIFTENRPPIQPGRLDLELPDIALDLRDVIEEAQEAFRYPTCRLDESALDELAVVLVEWAEDIHATAGLWRALENYQNEFFGTPLPPLLKPGESVSEPFDPRRLQHLLYIFWRQLKPDLILSPDHTDLPELTATASEFLAAAFHQMSRDSSVRRFLRTPNVRGWDVKKKLVWAGRHSFLFRHQCAAYHHGNATKSDVETTDDFICQHCTDWSGLGVIDLLAGALDLPDADRSELRTWYERHNAPYTVAEITKRGSLFETMRVINVVNDQDYRVRIEMEKCPFAVGQVVIGSLVPWRGDWYWSGGQRVWEKADPPMLARLKKEYVENVSAIAYRYCPDLAQKARDAVREHYGDFTAHYGDDLAIFPDGLTLAAAEQKRMQESYKKRPAETVASVMQRHGLRNPWPNMPFPDKFLSHGDGIGVFFNPDEGLEYVLNCNHILSGFRKQGVDLTGDEVESIRGFIEAENISPAFVQRVVREHGCGAVGRAYMIRNFQQAPHLDWLLRRFKGKFFRRRYPAISFVQGLDPVVKS